MIMPLKWLCIGFFLCACAHHAPETGIASYYGHRGGRTASGEVMRFDQLTAAHRTLPFGTLVRVTEVRSSRSVVVRINDRGPFVRGRIIDLSPAAFARIAPLSRGVVRVRLHVLHMGKERPKPKRCRRKRR